MNYKEYQVGDLEYYKEDDPTFDNYKAAIKHATTLSYNDNPIGVWSGQDEGSELVAIVYQQRVYTE